MLSDAIHYFYKGKYIVNEGPDNATFLELETGKAITLSKEDINKAVSAYKSHIENNQYKQERAVLYKSVKEQLDMIYWDRKNGTNTWMDHIDSVKQEKPKPQGA